MYKEKKKNVLIYAISCKTSTDTKPLHIRFSKIGRFIKTHFGVKCLVLFDYWWLDKLCDKIKYFIIAKGGVTGTINHIFGKTGIDSNNPLLIVFEGIDANPVRDGWGRQNAPSTCFSPVTSTNVGNSRQYFLTLTLNPFATPV